MNSAFLLNTLHLDSLLPEAIIILTLLVLLVIDLLSSTKRLPFIITLTNIGLALSLLVLIKEWPVVTEQTSIILLGSFKQDILAISFRIIIVVTAWLSFLLSADYVKDSGTALVEFITILLTATLGSMLLAGSNDFITAFVSLETLSLSSYLLSGPWLN